MTLSLRTAALLLLSFLSISTLKAQFTPGNLAILQAASSNNDVSCSIIELTPATAGQSGANSTSIPFSGANVFAVSGSASSTCYLANSNDGTLLCFTGANVSSTANVNTLNPRVVGTLNVSKTFTIPTTASYTGISGDQTRCATTLDNSTWFIGDQGGIYTNGATAPTPSGNFRAVKAFGGVVYAAQADKVLAAVSTVAAPPSGSTVTALPGIGANNNLVDFYLISSGMNGNTFDVLYTLSNDGSKKGGVGTINKFSLISGAWVASTVTYTLPSTIGSTSNTNGGFGLAAQKSGNGATLFVTTLDGGTAGNSVVSLTDAAGFNADLSINTANDIVLYTANPSTAVIKGVAFAPTGTITPTPTTVNLSVSTNKASESTQTVVTITATASTPVSGDQTVSLTASNHEGITSDYTLSGNTITIPGGSTTGTATFTVVDDNVVEGLEVDTLQISNPSSGITLGATTAQLITIQDNDASPTLMRITEYMYSGNNGEFAEFTNIGSTPIDMTGWSYDDNGATPGAVSLTPYGIVKPGESVILTETQTDSFRKDWSLCTGVPVIGGNTDNLGRSDQINLYDNKGQLVDRLTYGDQTFPGTIRTQDVSGYVSKAALGIDSIAGWKLSAVGDAEGSTTSTGGDIGSPGKSTMATVTFDPCFVDPNAPTIVMDVTNTSNFLDQGDSASPASPYTISGVIGDTQDPASTQGFYFTIGGGNVPVNKLTVTATSSNLAVVPASNLILSGSNASYNLLIVPAGVGYASVTVTVSSGTDSSSYVIDYAASNPAFTSSSGSVTWPTGSSDASTAYGLDNQYMVIGDDQQNRLLVYNRAASGLPVTTFDYTVNNNLGLTDGSPGNYKQVDVEMSAVSPVTPGRVYWSGSMGNSSSTPYGLEDNRNRTFRVDISGTGATTAFTFGGVVSLRQQLINWGDKNGYNFSASAAAGTNPKTIDGFNLEGMVFAPDNKTLYMGFRAPLVPTANRTNAVIAPILNFETWFNNGAPTDTATLGTPIELNLGGRGIREMIRLTNGNYVIAAGSYDGTSNPAIYTWTGNATDAPVQATSFDVTGQNPEALIQVNQGGQLALDQLQVISDDGSTVFYNDGIEAKDLPEDNFQKFSSAVVSSSDPIALPLVFTSFTAQRQVTNVLLNWTTGIPGNLASFTVQRSVDGTTYSNIATLPAPGVQTAFTYTDVNVPTSALYYRILATELSGQQVLSTVQVVGDGSAASAVQLFPNPVVGGTFTLITPAAGLKHVSIYNAAGLLIQQAAYTDTSKEISTTGWATGTYLIRIIMADGSTAIKEVVVL
jgi:Lamin Tail Domain/Secretion system C-terminal sorting domain